MLMETVASDAVVAIEACFDAGGLPLIEVGDLMISRAEIEDPCAFLDTERGKEWLKPFTSNLYYTQWYDYQRSPHDLKWGNELAEKILDLKRCKAETCDIETMFEEQFSGGQSAEDVYFEEHHSRVTGAIEDLSDLLDEIREDDGTLPTLDTEAWEEAVRDVMVDHMYENDDSTVMDMLGSSDRCEIMFDLTGDDDVYSNKAWADFAHLSINQSLQKALASMGYTVGDYRRMSGNKEQSHGLKRVARRPQPLLDEKELRSLVEEACSSHFSFVLYAMVPVRALFDLDLTKPISLTSYAIASYDSMNGTFYEINRSEAITMQPGEADLRAPKGYSPDSICGFVKSAFHADIANVE